MVKAKRIVGIVLIVAGALALLGAAVQYHRMVVPKHAATVQQASVPGSLGSLLGPPATAHNTAAINPKMKLLAILMILIGGLLTIIGAVMVNNRAPEPIDAYEIDIENDASKGPSFKL
jgi:hypothetical protein